MSTGNRPADVCALCDRPIEGVGQGPHGFAAPGSDHHRYVGPGWVHGGGRECIATHWSCLTADRGRLMHRIPGWVPDAERPEWLAEWEGRFGRFALKMQAVIDALQDNRCVSCYEPVGPGHALYCHGCDDGCDDECPEVTR